MCVGSIVKHVVKVEGRELIVDPSNRKEAGLFKEKDYLTVTTPNYLHVLTS